LKTGKVGLEIDVFIKEEWCPQGGVATQCNPNWKVRIEGEIKLAG
jgi:hypothetical protein